MPYLSIQTNQSLDDAARLSLMQQASTLVANQLGKPEKYVMVAITPSTPMLFAGSSEPLAFLELKSIGLPESSTTELSAALCHLMADALTIQPDRVYIEFINAQPHLWGWNGKTF